MSVPDAGALAKLTPDAKPVVALVSGCEMCEAGMKPRGERYCLTCADLVKRELQRQWAEEDDA